MLISKALGKTSNSVYMLYLVLLLLLLPGDVELTFVFAIPPSRTGDPREILRAKSDTLTDAISINLDKVAVKLNAKGLIPKQALDDTSIVGIGDYKKASKLVGVLQTQLGSSKNPRQYLIEVCNLLQNDLEDKTLADHATDMLKELRINRYGTQQERHFFPWPRVHFTISGEPEIKKPDHPNEGATAAEKIIVHVPDFQNVSEWCPEMEDIPIKPEPLTSELINDVNIIVMTATDIEYRAVMGTGRKIREDDQGYTQVELDDVTFNLVMYGSYKVAVIRTGQGPGRAEAMLEKIRAVIKAQYVIAVGICYGMKEGKTKLGDIIIAESIMDTSSRRASGHDLPARPEGYKSGEKLRNMFSQKQGFKLGKGDGTNVAIHCGVLVSENTLVASQEYKDAILKQIPQALGGEMEGVGLMTAAEKGKYEGIVIKAIADWGNENKEPYRKSQEFAAVAAAKYLLYRLQATENLKKQ